MNRTEQEACIEERMSRRDVVGDYWMSLGLYSAPQPAPEFVVSQQRELFTACEAGRCAAISCKAPTEHER
jgi:hypothetical protein